MHGRQPALRRRFVATTDSNHDAPIFPDRARKLAVVDRPNQLWVADLTYVAIAVGVRHRSRTDGDQLPHSASP
jgi:putative transposase